VVIAQRWEDVHCAGAVRMPDGYVPRVGSARDRAMAVSFEREAARERDLEAQIGRAVGGSRTDRGAAPLELDPPAHG
jgi:hypothetical protein